VPQSNELTLAEAARVAGVSPATLRKWGRDGVIPPYRGRWTAAAAAHARIVARLRERGHSLREIKQAGEDGRLAFGFVQDLFPQRDGRFNLEQAARQTGLEPALIERIWRGMGFPEWMLERLDDDDLAALGNMASVLGAGFPLVAFLQALHVYGQSIRQIADAETSLWRIYVHEPLMRERVPGMDIAQELEELVVTVFPHLEPLMDYLHRRYLRYYVEQALIAGMEEDLDVPARKRKMLGEIQVAIAFADLVGFVQFTEERGEAEALDLIEQFVVSVEGSLPTGARTVKNIGDGVMIVGNDPVALTSWAVGFQEGFEKRARPRIGIHYGVAVFRDGDYYGRSVNLASRVVGRAQAGEVVVSETVRDAMPVDVSIVFESIGEFRLKGIAEPMRLFLAHHE
jgi:adenylate cyclase